MKTFFTIIFFAVVCFDFFMVTPFGMYWTMKDLDEGKSARGIILAFILTPIIMVVGSCLGLV